MVFFKLLFNNDKDFVCTHVIAGQRSPAVKKWIAYSEGFAKATVIVNQGAKLALLSHEHAASLLLPGIVAIDGDFKKDDILLIKDGEGQIIGVGKASTDRAKIEHLSDTKHAKPLIHYDYLYIYPNK